jgi:hypothetical protein
MNTWAIPPSYRYAFDNADFIRGIETRLEFHRRLREANTQELVLSVVNEIMRWGGLRELTIDFVPQLQIALNTLDAINGGHEDNWNYNLIGKRITTISKIYEMYNPRLWSIYDSRVGKGIQFFVSLYEPNLGNVSEYLRFQCPPGRNRGPINGFRQVSSPRQVILGFLYASWLFRAIASRLNDDHIPLPEEVVNLQQDINWAVYHIEMVFFMIGR